MTTAELRVRIEVKTAQLFAANELYLKLLSQDMSEYRFHSGEGTQWVIKRKLTETQAIITKLEEEIEYLQRKLDGTGLVNLTLRRI